jgi:hypothetical protein
MPTDIARCQPATLPVIQADFLRARVSALQFLQHRLFRDVEFIAKRPKPPEPTLISSGLLIFCKGRR